MGISVRALARRRMGLHLAVAGAASFVSFAPVGAARADDMATITARVQAQLLSQAPSTSTVRSYMNSIQSNGSWSDISYSSTAQTNWSPGTHLSRMAAMAEVWANPNSSLYHNATLASDLRLAMDYWFSFSGNSTSAPGSADNYGNPTPYSTNWFDNDISGPQALGSAMVMASSVFTSAELSEAQNYLLNAKKEIPSFTGQNVVDLSIVGVYSSIASGNTNDMTSAFNSMNGTIFVSNFGTDGIQADHSYHIHGIQLYMGGYGTSYIDDMLNWASISAGTSYALNTSQEHTLVDYLLDGTQWFIRGQTLDLTADGRQVTFPTYVGAGDGYVTAIQDALALGNYRTAELQNFLARQEATISSGAANSGANNLSGNRDFFDSDIMVQQRPAYYASVKVASNRTSDPETGNNQGLKNLYLGDGVNQIMVTGNEYLGIQPVWNWRRLPGTTVEQDSRSLTPTGTFGSVYGTTSYAGGVSDGTYGAEAFNYSRFHVNAHKSWFFFDNEEVALGNGIKAPNATSEVDTTLNQCLLTSDVLYETSGTSGYQTLATGSTTTPSGLKWVYQGDVGYFFVNPVSNATIQAISQSGNWSSINTAASGSVTDNVFTLYINHGSAVSNGSYAYIAVPGIATSNMTDAQVAAAMDNYLANNPILVLTSNSDANVQGVYQSTLHMTQAAFYTADTLTLNTGATVASSAPSAMILQNTPNTLKLSASSPQASSGALNLTLTNVNLSGGSSWFDAMGTAVAGFTLPGGNYAGATVGITLSSDGKSTPTVSLSSNDQSSNSTYTVTGAVALAADTTFEQDSFTTLAFSNTVSGNASVTESAGTLVLSGSNTFTGGLFVNGGIVRANSSGALGPSAATVHPTGVLVIGAGIASPITLAGGTLNFSGSPSLSGILTAAAGTNSVIQTADPANPNTSINVPFTGTLNGSGNITLVDAAGDTSPDGSQAFRLQGNNASNFSGTITLSNNVKGELFGNNAGVTTPAGTGTIVMTAGDAALGNTLNTATVTGGYSELNLRNNSSGSEIFGNNVVISGSGLAVLNPLGTAPANASVTMGDLQIGNGQQLGVYLASSFNTHPVIFESVTLTGGTATFSPKINGFGAASSVSADLTLGSISELQAGSGIAMNGLRTLTLNGNNNYSGATTVSAGALVFAPNPITGPTTSHIAAITGTAPVIINAGATVVSDGIQLASLTLNGSVQIRPNDTSTGTSKISSLAIAGTANAWTGAFDLTNNSLIVEDGATHNATLATLQNQVVYGIAHQTGIFSSTLPSYEGMAVLDNAVAGFNTFGGVQTNGTDILVAPELLGDANGDGEVNVDDLQIVLNHFGQTTSAWTDGNFDHEPTVNLADLSYVLKNMGASLSSPPGSNSNPAPEPGSVLLMAGVVPMLLSRRRGA